MNKTYFKIINLIKTKLKLKLTNNFSKNRLTKTLILISLKAINMSLTMIKKNYSEKCYFPTDFVKLVKYTDHLDHHIARNISKF